MLGKLLVRLKMTLSQQAGGIAAAALAAAVAVEAAALEVGTCWIKR